MDSQSLCEVCKVNTKQYKCPRCGLVSCSLKCCKDHKLQNKCSGIRDKTAFVPLSELQDHNIKSDFHFLEDVLRTKGSAKRTFLASSIPSANKKKKVQQVAEISNKSEQNLDSYDKATKELVFEANIRELKLLLLPAGMSKRNENPSFFDTKRKVIMWKISMVFVRDADFSWQDLFSFDCIRPSNQGHFFGLNMVNVDENAVLGNFLQHSMETLQPSWSKEINLTDIHCLLRKIPSAANDPLFVEVNMNDTLTNCLRGQVVIEYPTIYVVPIAFVSKFRLFITIYSKETEIKSESHMNLISPSNDEHERTFHEEIFEVLCGRDHHATTAFLKQPEEAEEEENFEEEAFSDEIVGKAYDEFIRALTDLEDQNVDNLRSIIEECDQ